MEAALTHRRADGFEVRDEDVARLSPLLHEHINAGPVFILGAGLGG